jgi:hypothetical protein
MAKKRAARTRQKPRRTIAVTEFPYYDDFYVEKVSKPVGLSPADDDAEEPDKRRTFSGKRELSHR